MPENPGVAGIRSAAVVGGGVIGASWAALFLARGLSVTVSDPQPGVDEAVRRTIAEASPALQALGLDTSKLTADLSFEPDLAAAVRTAGVVQENGPERLEVKHEMWRVIEANAPADALFTSSTSGIPATEIATVLKAPERLVIGHPFNPPHLVPLVEVVPGDRTSSETIERARAFYLGLDKRPQVLRKEVPGFVANRLQAAMFRECVHLVREGVVTMQELDDIVTSSIGQRWAGTGPFRSFHLGGGEGGLAHFMDHLGVGMERRWAAMVKEDVAFDESTKQLLNEQANEFGGTIDELATERDRAQIAVMRALGDG
ncbi:3-hydroxyacyl-CoA dehydrogenase NAD-binding domain-containing protein [Streptomyces sp900105755]|uniref:3-hydroxyacyl-CoA dehydrogenase NAD-binding domain-containing protein n=1 Tax=Streptomyces sp. 900105755 TaxID=3154389 RepID=UPI00332CA574